MAKPKPHGIIKNSNSRVEFPGVLVRTTADSIIVKIDGSVSIGSENYLPIGDGWSFEPDFDPRTHRKGVWTYYQYSLDINGDMSNFPNLIVHLSGGWFSIGNSSADSYRLSDAEVTKLFTAPSKPVPLTYQKKEADNG